MADSTPTPAEREARASTAIAVRWEPLTDDSPLSDGQQEQLSGWLTEAREMNAAQITKVGTNRNEDGIVFAVSLAIVDGTPIATVILPDGDGRWSMTTHVGRAENGRSTDV